MPCEGFPFGFRRSPKGATQNLGNLIKSVGSDCIAQQKSIVKGATHLLRRLCP